MSVYQSLEDTIAAISTAKGEGGIGIIRLSGHDAIAIAGKLFKPAGRSRLARFKNFTLHYGWIVDGTDANAQVIDEVLLSVMRGPRSYTKEDMVEISCHGGYLCVQAILKRAVSLGARLAQPGEFTKRAYLNGRIDLTQAESDRKSTRLNSSHSAKSRMPSSA